MDEYGGMLLLALYKRDQNENMKNENININKNKNKNKNKNNIKKLFSFKNKFINCIFIIIKIIL